MRLRLIIGLSIIFNFHPGLLLMIFGPSRKGFIEDAFEDDDWPYYEPGAGS